MILRNCVARHGKRPTLSSIVFLPPIPTRNLLSSQLLMDRRIVRPTLSRPLSCSNIRRYTTTNDGRAGNGGSNEMMGGGGLEAGKAHAPVDLPPSSPLSASSKKKKKQKELQEVIMSLSADSSREHGGPSWTNTQQWGTSDELRTPAQQYADFERIQRTTRSLGTRVERRYVPTELINNPPGPEDVTLELLMASQTHMGHNTSLWNPANSRYIYGVRQGIHIISLETTAAHLRRAARVVEETSYRGGLILFVGNRAGQMEIVTKAAKMSGACHLFTKWTPGAITNRDVILKMQDIKVVDHMDRELDEFESFKGSARPLLPDLVVCLNPVENYTLLYECGLKSIPTIGIIDTNADPSWVTYTIPANDDRYV